ncbi:MAG: sugar phosphate nucleotidyltransferase [Sumerlaeia bacterium]
MRAIIPVAGFGSRMRPHTYTVPKVLMNVAGKPMLDHIIDSLVEAGITGVTLIVGYLGDVIEEHARKKYSNIEINCVPQPQMLGLGHAISLGKSIHKDDDDLLIILGDTILQADFKALFSTPDTAIGVKAVEDPRRFGVVETDKSGRIVAMHEKLENPPSNEAIVGVYKINDPALLFSELDSLMESGKRTKGEFQLTDALAGMLERGHVMKPFQIDGWLDCGKPETLFETNRTLLDLSPAEQQKSYQAKYPDSVIVPPVFIAKGCAIKDSVVGPYAVLGENTSVKGSILRDTIVGAEAQLKNVFLDNSLIGDKAQVEGHPQSINIGDSSAVSI